MTTPDPAVPESEIATPDKATEPPADAPEGDEAATPEADGALAQGAGRCRPFSRSAPSLITNHGTYSAKGSRFLMLLRYHIAVNGA